jgi:hypothetical protein
MSDDVTITVRVNDQTATGFRDVNGRLRDMNGRFASSAGDMRRSSSAISAALVDVKASLLSLAPAAVPVAASFAPIAAQAGAAGLAVAAFGVALKPQITSMTAAADAQKKYTEAVKQYGAGSKQAFQAGQEAARVLGTMPEATQRAAVSLGQLRKQAADWSDSMAKFTMAPVEKSFAVLGQVIPKLTPMVQGTSTQLERLMTVAGGGVSTGAFDTLSKKVGDFANQTLKGATDRAISFMRALSEGNASGPIASFFEYARQQGPAVKELLTSVSQAVSNLLEGAAQAGPGLLSLVNAMAQLVASVPASLISNLLQVYAAVKLIKLASAGVGAAAGGFATLSGRLTTMRAAAVAAGGGLAGMNAALNTLSTGGKAALALGVVGALAVAMHKLSDNKAPVAVDELSTSLNTLASTGKVTGALKTNFDEMSSSIAMVSKSASDNKIASMVSDFGTWVGIATGPSISDAKKNLDAWDKSMASLVRGGKPKEAAAQFEILKKAWLAGGGDLKRLKTFTNDYNDALADAAFEQKMAAESQGLFGGQAQKTQAALDAQKASADGLRQSIQALNDVNRAGLGGMIGFEAAIDAAAKAAKDNAGALSMNHGVLDLNSEKARTAASALSDLAAKTEEAAASARESGSSWETVNGIYSRGRDALIKQADAMGLTKAQATQLADQILKIPSGKKVTLEMRTEDAVSGLNSVISAMKKTPGSKSVTVKALTKDAVGLLQDIGLKVTRLKDGSFRITANGKIAKDVIDAVKSARDGLKNKSITLSATDGISGKARAAYAAVQALHNRRIILTTEHRTINTGKGGRGPNAATGGLLSALPSQRLAGGGEVQYGPNGLITGPGSGTSDSIVAFFDSGAAARVSNTEFVVNAASTRKYLPLLEAINSNQLKLPGFARGGVTKAESQARKDARGDLTISHFGQMAGYQRSEFGSALGKPDSVSSLVNALNQWRSTILKATHGGQERSLLRALDSTGKKLLGWEKQLGKVSASLEKAKDKLDSLKSAAASLSDSVKSGVLNASNITRGGSGDTPITVASVMGGLTASRDKATAFSKALADLKKKGLSSALLQQIAEAGPDGGGLETAGALLQASTSEIGSLNSLQSQITSSATSAGKTTADAVYGSAIKAQEMQVKKLANSQEKLARSMDKLARAMEKQIESAFKKKASGGIIGAASGGLRSGWTMVGEHEPELVRLPFGSRVYSGPDTRRMQQQAWASMLNTPRNGGARYAPTPAGAADGQPLVIQVRIGERDFGELWVDAGRKAVKARGSIQAALQPPRGR